MNAKIYPELQSDNHYVGQIIKIFNAFVILTLLKKPYSKLRQIIN